MSPRPKARDTVVIDKPKDCASSLIVDIGNFFAKNEYFQRIQNVLDDKIKGLSQITLKRGYYGCYAQEPSEPL